MTTQCSIMFNANLWKTIRILCFETLRCHKISINNYSIWCCQGSMWASDWRWLTSPCTRSWAGCRGGCWRGSPPTWSTPSHRSTQTFKPLQPIIKSRLILKKSTQENKQKLFASRCVDTCIDMSVCRVDMCRYECVTQQGFGNFPTGWAESKVSPQSSCSHGPARSCSNMWWIHNTTYMAQVIMILGEVSLGSLWKNKSFEYAEAGVGWYTDTCL